jgi:predicted O-methyltransferase YrrM
MVLGRRFSLDSGRPKDVSAKDVTGQRDTAGSRTPRPRLVLERLLGERTAVARSNGTVQSLFPVAVGAAEGEALRAWVQGENATRTIEIGLGYGIAALFVCEGLLANGDPAARHVAVDPNQATRFANCGLQFLDEAGVAELVEFHPEESELALPRFLAEARSFDLAFVDGNHRFDGVFLDLIYLGRLVRAGGILFVDDYQLPSVARAVAFCTTNLGWTLEESSAEDDLHHWAVLRTSRVLDSRTFDDYVDF